MNDELPLIERAQQGDADAFGQLVRLHQNRLLTSVIYTIGHPQEAEDVVQDAFIQAYLKLGSFKGQSSFYTWLYRIAMRMAINRQRRWRPEISTNQVLPQGGLEPADSTEPPAEYLLRQERANQLQQALGRLNEEYRAVLVLREIEDFDYQTIAQILDISVGTVRSRLHRARSALRAQLSRYHPE